MTQPDLRERSLTAIHAIRKLRKSRQDTAAKPKRKPRGSICFHCGVIDTKPRAEDPCITNSRKHVWKRI